MNEPILLRARGLTRRFTLATEVVHALEDIDLDIHEGEFLAVLGPSGSGKSTLLALLGGLDRPTAGTVQWRGQPFSDLPERELVRLRSREVGFVFQDALLMAGLDALGNVRLPQVLAGGTDRGDHALELLERFALGDKRRRLPRQLSRGETQRVAMARALANEPSLLLADEPTGNLDRAATRDTFAALQELNNEHRLTVVVATHDEAVVDYGTRQIFLRDGRLYDGEDR